MQHKSISEITINMLSYDILAKNIANTQNFFVRIRIMYGTYFISYNYEI